MRLVWDENAWADYVWWQTEDRRVLRRINALIKDIERGYWSRRITDEHRLIHRIDHNEIRVAACRCHYG